MGKKKGQSGRGNAQAALQNQITRMQIKALEPFVAQQVQNAAQQMQQKLAQQQLSYVADANVRIYLLEDIVCEKLGYNRDQLSEMILDHEDDAMSLKKVDRGAQKGDHVRVNVSFKQTEVAEGEAEPVYSDENRFILKDLLEEGSKHIYNLVELSEGVVGMKAGETKEVLLEKQKVLAKINIQRVCEKVVTEEVENAG